MSVASHVRRQAEAYLRTWPDDRDRLAPLLTQIRENPESLLDRACMRGHVTTSALVLSPDLDEVLLIHNRALDMWLQPGGHYQPPGTLLSSAIAEAVQETGARGLRPLRPGRVVAIDIDVHTIPARPSRNEGGHVHHDFMFALVAGFRNGVEAGDDADDVAWRPMARILAGGDRLSRAARRIVGVPPG